MSSELLKSQEDFIQPVDIGKAELHNEATRVRDLMYSRFSKSNVCGCCNMPVDAPKFSLNCKITELGQLGVGIPLHFYLVKILLSLLFIGSALIGIACVINNYEMSHSSVSKTPSNWATNSSMHQNKDPIWQGILHSLYIIVIIISIVYFRKFIHNKIIEIDQLNVTPADFTVHVTGLPINTDLNDLRNYMQNDALPFGQKAEVISISPSYYISEFVSKSRKLKKLNQKLNYIIEYRAKNGREPVQKFCCCTRRYQSEAELSNQIKELTDWKKNFESTSSLKFEQGSSAFVTFRRQTDCKEIIDYWHQSDIEKFSRYTTFCLHQYFYQHRRYNGVTIEIKAAPEPSDIIWENLTVSLFVKILKRFQTFIIAFILILVSFFIVLLIKSYEYDRYKKSGSHISNSESLNIKFISFALSLSIFIVNIIITSIVRMFSVYEKHMTWTLFNVSVFHKLVVSTTLNTVLVLYLVNSFKITDNLVNPAEFDIHWFSAEYGLSTDLYNLLLLDACLTPIGLIFSPIYLMKLWTRRQIRRGKKIVTQAQANQIWMNPEIDVAQRSAKYIRTFLVVLVFSPIFPMGFFMGMISILFQYWTDKILLLRRDSRSRALGKDLSLAVLRWLPLSLLCYSVSNLLVQYEANKDKEDRSHIIAPIIGLVITVLYFFVPFRKICGKSVMAEEATKHIADPGADENDFTKQILRFTDDYLRSNPVISKSSWKKWLEVIKDIHGEDQSKNFEASYSNQIANAEYSMPLEDSVVSFIDPRKSGGFNNYIPEPSAPQLYDSPPPPIQHPPQPYYEYQNASNYYINPSLPQNPPNYPVNYPPNYPAMIPQQPFMPVSSGFVPQGIAPYYGPNSDFRN